MTLLRGSAFLLVLLTGCGAGIKTFPVKGQVVSADVDVNELADSHVEFELNGDPTVRGSGLITSDGRYRVEMLHKGQVVTGLPTGQYRGRIVLSDEGPDAKKRRSLVARRFLDFKTAGLSITVPIAEEITFAIAKR